MPALSPEEWSNWASIGPVTRSSSAVIAQCTGTLIAPDLVLTAAHCVPNHTAGRPMYFVAGWNDGRMVARLRSVETKIHPSYAKASDEEKVFHDVATIRLERPVSPRLLSPLPVKAYARSMQDPFAIVGYHRHRPTSISGKFDCPRAPTPRFGELHLACFVVSGNSGAPVLVDDNGTWNTIGVVVATLGEAGAFAVPVDAWVLGQWSEALERTKNWK